MKLPLLILFLASSVLLSQIGWEGYTQLPADDSAMPMLQNWQRKVVENNPRAGTAKAHFSSWAEMPFPSLKTLFPSCRFFVISWIDLPLPGKEDMAVGLGGGEYTLICTGDGKLLKEIYHYGNYEPYGEFLATKRVSISSQEDAKRVWDGFCDIHQKHWKDNPSIKVSDTIWHLGGVTIHGVHYYYEVILDTAQTVVSARLHADDVNQQIPKSAEQAAPSNR